jgi:hypothetical protein
MQEEYVGPAESIDIRLARMTNVVEVMDRTLFILNTHSTTPSLTYESFVIL